MESDKYSQAMLKPTKYYNQVVTKVCSYNNIKNITKFFILWVIFLHYRWYKINVVMEKSNLDRILFIPNLNVLLHTSISHVQNVALEEVLYQNW